MGIRVEESWQSEVDVMCCCWAIEVQEVNGIFSQGNNKDQDKKCPHTQAHKRAKTYLGRPIEFGRRGEVGNSRGRDGHESQAARLKAKAIQQGTHAR